MIKFILLNANYKFINNRTFTLNIHSLVKD